MDYFREYDSYWLGVGRGQYINLFMTAAGLCIVAVVRKRAEPESGMVVARGMRG